MNRIEIDIYVTRYGIPERISYVQATNAIPLIFHIRDYDIPSGSTARVYVKRPDGTSEYDSAVLSGNDVTVDVKDTMFSVVGTSKLQIRISKESKKLVSFAVDVYVEKNYADGGVKSENAMDIFDKAFDGLEEATRKAEQAAKNIQTKADRGDFTGTVQIGEVTTGEPGSQASASNSGTGKDAVINLTIPQGYKGVSMRMAGVWAAGTEYVNNTSYIDLVTYQGSTYGCKKTHTASEEILPTNAEYWQCLAEKGEIGGIENIDTTPISFEEAAERENIESGEPLPTGLGKIKKWLSDFKQAAFMNVVNGVTQSEAGQAVLDAAVGKYLDEKKLDISRLVANRNITEPGFAMDGKTLVEWLNEKQNSLSLGSNVIPDLDSLFVGCTWYNAEKAISDDLPFSNYGFVIAFRAAGSAYFQIGIPYGSSTSIPKWRSHVNNVWQKWKFFSSNDQTTYIPDSNTNLNNYTNPGSYFKAIFTKGSDMNYPYDGAGWLEVSFFIGSSGTLFVFQRYTVWGTTLVYTRFHNANGWTDWKQVGGLVSAYHQITITSSVTIGSGGYNSVHNVPASEGRPVSVSIVGFPNMSDGMFNVAISGQYIYLISDPGTTIGASTGSPIIIGYMTI